MEVCLVVLTPGERDVSRLRASAPRPGKEMASPGSVCLVHRMGTCLMWWVVVSIFWRSVFCWIISPSAMGNSSLDKIGQSGGAVEVCNALPSWKWVIRNPKVSLSQSTSLSCQ